ncbi:hypothetical protein [Rickettsia endosymbiont of Ixodes pacificus]|uniref:hypothetical protein n=1 Tax=Rickettsia endosymbiont of Ixodes pacificus TaxID=1133329 RepID=UPI000AFBE400|nr:hypothetical protein [Rickettsia endosymbiont of Ixodes pacificus]
MLLFHEITTQPTVARNDDSVSTPPPSFLMNDIQKNKNTHKPKLMGITKDIIIFIIVY